MTLTIKRTARLHFSLTLPHQIFTEAFGGSGVKIAANSRLVASWVRKKTPRFEGRLGNLVIFSY